MSLMQQVNPGIEFILTVSPVPLIATMSDNHVMVATMESKSILRAVAGQLASSLSEVDYFPSYEIINSPVFKGVFFEPDQRNVNPHGVDYVVQHLFKSLGNKFKEQPASIVDPRVEDIDQVCEEELLDAFREGR